MSSVFDDYDVTFDSRDCANNILTKKVLTKKVDRFLDAKETGKTRYEQFVTEMLEGERSTWDTIKKEKLTTFVSNNETENVTLNNQAVQIKHTK